MIATNAPATAAGTGPIVDVRADITADRPARRRAPTAPEVLVLGTGITALGALRGLGRAGIAARLAGDDRDEAFVRRSRWYRRAPGAEGLEPDAAILEAFLRSGVLAEGTVLLPCTDAWCRAVAALPPDIAVRFPSSVASAAVMDVLVDKGRFGAALEAARLPHPRTHVLRSVGDLDAVSDEAIACGFLKPRDSQPFFRRFGVKAVRPGTRAEAERLLVMLEADGMEVVLQEFIPGAADRHVYVEGFVDRTGRVVACFVRRRLRIFPPDFGNSTAMVSVAESEAADAVATMTALASVLGYRGIFSAEFKLDVRDGLHKLLEVNARPWWYVEFAQRCGVNVCELAYRDALGLPLPDVVHGQIGRRLVYPYYEVAALVEHCRRGRLPGRDWLRSWLGAGFPFLTADDPLPAADRLVRRVVGVLGRFARRRQRGRGPR